MKRGWEVKKLGEVLTIERGGSPRPIEKYITNAPDGINWIKISDATASDKFIYETKEKITRDGLHKTRIVNEGDFILSNSMSFGRPYIMKTTGCIHDGWLVLKQNGKKIFETEFLYYLLSSPFVFQQFNSKAAGSTVRNLNIALVSSVDVPIPPLPEQQRIVAILDEAFAAIAKAKANAEQNLKNAKELFESYLQSVFENKGEDWKETALNNEIDLLVGFAFKSKEYTEMEDDVLLLRGDNIMQGNLRWDNAKRWRKSEYEDFKKYQLQENDIVLAMDRPWVKAGLKVARLSKNDLPALLVQRTACLRTKSKLDNSFLFYLLKSKGFMSYLIDVQTGIGVPHISGQQILDFKFNKPSINLQQIIVQKLDALSAQTKKLEAIYQQHLNDLEELKKSILQKAFNGELKQNNPEGME